MRYAEVLRKTYNEGDRAFYDAIILTIQNIRGLQL